MLKMKQSKQKKEIKRKEKPLTKAIKFSQNLSSALIETKLLWKETNKKEKENKLIQNKRKKLRTLQKMKYWQIF